MAYSSSFESTEDIALFEADNPIIIPKNILNDCIQGPFNQNSLTPAMTDSSDSDYPIDNAYDGYNHKSNTYSSTATTHCITGQNNENSFNTIFFHCEDPSNDIASIRLRVSNSSTWATYEDFDTDSSVDTTIRRYLSRVVLSGNPKYITDLNYFLVAATFSSATAFYWNELFLGRRIQLKHAGYGYDVDASISERNEHRSVTGITIFRYKSAGRREFKLRFIGSDSTSRSRLRQIITDTDYGKQSIVFCEKPYSEPEKAGLYHIVNRDFKITEKAYGHEELILHVREQGGKPYGIE